MIITMTQRKGGPGKSTVATNLAACFAGQGIQVGLLDVDTQETAKNWFWRRQINGVPTENLEFKHTVGDFVDTLIAMANRNEILIVDTAGWDSAELAIALTYADLAIAPFRPKVYDLESVGEVRNMCARVTAARSDIGRGDLVLRGVINQGSSNSKQTRTNDAITYLTNQGLECFGSVLAIREAYGDAAEEGLGVTEFTDTKAAAEIEALAAEILEFMGAA